MPTVVTRLARRGRSRLTRALASIGFLAAAPHAATAQRAATPAPVSPGIDGQRTAPAPRDVRPSVPTEPTGMPILPPLPRGPMFSTPDPKVPGSELTIFLMTMGVGEEIWEQFGHNALWIHDAVTGEDAVYNWGLFDFNQPHFIPRFLKGQMLYSMGAFTYDQTMAEYRYRDRTVLAQELDLTPAQRLELQRFVQWNALPQNRDYHYDYYRDNCSTRVRDVIDRILGGAFKRAASQVPTGHSYRWQTMRLVQSNVPLATGMDIGLGEPSDHEMTQWEAMFLPMQLHDFAKRFVVRDSNGFARPLVKSERVLYRSQTHPEPADAPHWLAWDILIGLSVLGGMAALAWWSRQGKRGARIGLAALTAAVGLVMGLVGLLLVLLWAITDHYFAHHNENLFVYQPLWLALAVLAPMAVLGSRSAVQRWTRWIADLTLAAALVGIVWHLIGLSAQDNWRALALGVPAAIGMAVAVHRATRAG